MNSRTKHASLIFALVPVVAWAQAPPALVIEAPPALDAVRGRIESFDERSLAGIVGMVGLEEAGSPIHVVLAAEGSAEATRVSPWIAGFAVPEASRIVLFPSRSPVYPHDTLEDVLRHEVAHVLIGRAAGAQPVPRWFHEGLSVVVERPWGFGDRSRLASQLLIGPRLELREIDRLFGGEQSSQERAYVLSAAVVRDLIREHGAGAPAAIMRNLRGGASFAEAVEQVTARPVRAMEDAFWDRQRVWTMWMPLFTSANVLWLVMILLAALAVWRRRRNAAAIRRQWEEEEVPVLPEDRNVD